jgi:hypothetical protein
MAALSRRDWPAACADLAETYGRGWEEADGLIRHGAEQERAAIVAWLRKNAELNPHLPDARALVLLFSKAIEDGIHHERKTT